MNELQSLLKLLSDGLKAIAQGAEAISEKVDEIAQTQDTQKAKGKKPARKIPKKKEGKSATIADTVFNFISSSKNGASTSTIMKKTGLTGKQVSNIVFKLKKQGRIKSVGRGIYEKS